MAFKSLDKIFSELKKILSVIALSFIAMSLFMFIYWLLYSAKMDLPDWLNSFAWTVIDFFAKGLKTTKSYSEIVDILPVLCSVIFGVLTYIVNCLNLFTENMHEKYKKSVIDYRTKLENKINSDLHKDFLKDLKKSSFMLIKLKIEVIKKESYLSEYSEEKIDANQIRNEIEKNILMSVPSELIQNKGRSDEGVYFLLSDFSESKAFFASLVKISSKLIKEKIESRLNINFYCGVELFENISQFEEKSKYLDKVLELRIPNKIIITPKYKLYFDNLYSSYFNFNVQGEYSLSENQDSGKNIMLYSMQSK